MSVSFIETTPHDQPLFLECAPRAPHSPATPPLRYRSTFSNIPPLRPPSYNEADVSDKPAWLQTISPWDADRTHREDLFRQNQYGTPLAVDDAIADILGALERTHRLSNTLVLFASGAVRTENEKYVEYDDGEEELYDLSADPYELQNMAVDPGHADLKASLHARMLELFNPPPPGFSP
jgi:arylsulfatase A-like enzyme